MFVVQPVQLHLQANRFWGVLPACSAFILLRVLFSVAEVSFQ